ncbi:ECF transporter S component [Spiroplasma sp. BIUS-1]|uniref:ECF transporter S component n=1 Tax=Spiroplasma sp. BIUS-1 TaxID=216964 RepID=UPI001398B605|nr:ECF transporter S component [Spiroplasma sp. BIUS-1]QHX36487.1 ECF transporter S component [Spiroplasma sp. BIUS-1]
MENKNHDIPEHDDHLEEKKDHYHEEHHFDALGNHDDINDEDFHWKNSLFTSRRNLTFKITLTGVFLALAIAISAFEMSMEAVLDKIQFQGVSIPFRILDLMVITLSLSALGPIFASLIGFIAPFIHLADGFHNPLSVVIDCGGYFVSIWVIWFFYYFVFRNSSIHKHPIKSVDRFKRWTPMVAYVPIMTIVYTVIVFGIIYLNSLVGHDHDTFMKSVSMYHADHDHGHESWNEVIEHMGLFIGIISAIELARFSICYSLFAVIEPKVKQLNHYYK